MSQSDHFHSEKGQLGIQKSVTESNKLVVTLTGITCTQGEGPQLRLPGEPVERAHPRGVAAVERALPVHLPQLRRRLQGRPRRPIGNQIVLSLSRLHNVEQTRQLFC